MRSCEQKIECGSVAGRRRMILLICFGLVIITFAAFEPVRHNDFISYDDNGYIVENTRVNGGLSIESIKWAFVSEYASNWHPVTWLSHIIDCELFGLNPVGHHIMNLLFHTANTLLLFWILARMTDSTSSPRACSLWQSAFVAALFAVHPLHVESAAWAAERKDVLSGFFWMLGMLCYVRYVERPGAGRYIVLLLIFALGLMAKPMVVTLPFVMLLLDYWPLHRLSAENTKSETQNPKQIRITEIQNTKHVTGGTQRRAISLLLEKVPFFILAAAASAVTYVIQERAGTTRVVGDLSIGTRIGNAFVSYVGYISKMFYPKGLAVLYPHPGTSLAFGQVIISVLAIVAVTAGTIYLAKIGRRYAAVGWLWYMGTLVPVAGLIQVGMQGMADRYTYLPSVGIFIIIAWGIGELSTSPFVSQLKESSKGGGGKGWLRINNAVLWAGAVIVLSALVICTRIQLRYWRNSEALYEHALAVTKNNAVMHNHLGVVLGSQGRVKEAFEHYERAVEIRPDFAQAHNNLGFILDSLGEYERALGHFNEALKLDPSYFEAHNNLATMLSRQGKTDEAIVHFRKALAARPAAGEVHYNLALAFESQGNLDEAMEHYLKALDARHTSAEAYYNLGNIMCTHGKLQEAIGQYRKALELDRGYFEAHHNLGNVLLLAGQAKEALLHFQKASELRPQFPEPLSAMARILAMDRDPAIRDTGRAIIFAERAAKLSQYKDARVLETLAFVYAAAGQFDKAGATAQQAATLADAAGDKNLADYIRRQVEAYRQAP